MRRLVNIDPGEALVGRGDSNGDNVRDIKDFNALTTPFTLVPPTSKTDKGQSDIPDQLFLYKGNHQVLRWAGELGILDPGVANAAADAYLALRRRTHDAALNDEDKVIVGEGDLVDERAAVRALWAGVFEASPLRGD